MKLPLQRNKFPFKIDSDFLHLEIHASHLPLYYPAPHFHLQFL